MNFINIAKALPTNKCLSKNDILGIAQNITNNRLKASSSSWLCGKMINMGLIERVARNQYCVVIKQNRLKDYAYQPSDYLASIIKELSKTYSFVSFQAWEAIQFNYFVNHQIAHNTIFIEVENMLCTSIYEFLRDKYDGNVLLKPDKKTFELYAKDNTIVVTSLISETPINKFNHHLITIEKLIVDMLCNKLIPLFISKSEYRGIYEELFKKYRIDESKLFRYANRRNAKKKIVSYLNENTSVKLRTVGKDVN